LGLIDGGFEAFSPPLIAGEMIQSEFYRIDFQIRRDLIDRALKGQVFISRQSKKKVCKSKFDPGPEPVFTINPCAVNAQLG
jgi:hypothetical protein